MARHRGRIKERRVYGNPNKPGSLAALLLKHIEWVLVRGLSPMTAEVKERHVGDLIEWLEDRAITMPGEVTRAILERYQRHLYHHRTVKGEPLTFAAQKTRLIAIRVFFRWLARKHFIDSNPAADIELPKAERRIPRAILSESEAETVLAQPDLSTPLGVRDRAILEVFYATGARRAEVANLKLFDLDAERGTLMIREGKGRKDRLIPIGERAVAWVTKYTFEIRPQLVVGHDEGYIFLTDDGHPITPDHLSGIGSRHLKESGIGKRGSCHIWRHSAATLMLEGGADIRMIQALLGHSDLTSTQIYTRVAIKHLKEVYDRTHPGAMIKPDRDLIAD